jgi:uncharacterized protein YegP (UPF0339 family)
MAAQFELKTSRDRRSYFNLLASNGEMILTSQMYATKSGARKGIRSVQGNAGNSDKQSWITCSISDTDAPGATGDNHHSPDSTRALCVV